MVDRAWCDMWGHVKAGWLSAGCWLWRLSQKHVFVGQLAARRDSRLPKIPQFHQFPIFPPPALPRRHRGLSFLHIHGRRRPLLARLDLGGRACVEHPARRRGRQSSHHAGGGHAERRPDAEAGSGSVPGGASAPAGAALHPGAALQQQACRGQAQQHCAQGGRAWADKEPSCAQLPGAGSQDASPAE